MQRINEIFETKCAKYKVEQLTNELLELLACEAVIEYRMECGEWT